MSAQRLAGIDIGTLTCRLLIADLPVSGPLKELHSERRILRLGEGVDQSKRLKAEAMDRVVQCLREWKRVIDGYQVRACTAVATSVTATAMPHRSGIQREVVLIRAPTRRCRPISSRTVMLLTT